MRRNVYQIAVVWVAIGGLFFSGYAFGQEFGVAGLTHLSNKSNQGSASCVGCEHDVKVIKRWSMKHFPESYAGVYIVEGKLDQLVVGYTERQPVRVRALRHLSRLILPKQIVEFPYFPMHALLELDELQHRILEDVMENEDYSGLITSIGVAVQRNLVEVGTQRGNRQRTRSLLRDLYGTDAPICVRYDELPTELSS